MIDFSSGVVWGYMVDVPVEAVNALRGRLRGSALFSGGPGYDDARSVWNAMIDKRPGLIIKCAGVADVLQAFRPSCACARC